MSQAERRGAFERAMYAAVDGGGTLEQKREHWNYLARIIFPDEPRPTASPHQYALHKLKERLQKEASLLTWRDLDHAGEFSKPDEVRPKYADAEDTNAIYFARDLLREFFGMTVNIEQLIREGKKE